MEPKSLFLICKRQKSGLRMITMGLMAMLKREVEDVAFFKPIVTSPKGDTDIKFITTYFKLKQNPDTAWGITREEAKSLISNGQDQTVYEKIMERYNQLLSKYDFVLCQGMGYIQNDRLQEDSLDLKIAKNLQIPVILIMNAANFKTAKEAENAILDLKHTASIDNLSLLDIFFNRVPVKLLDNIKQKNSDSLCVFALPEVPELSQPTMADIASQTGAKIVSKDSSMLDRTVKDTKVAAMMLENYLLYLKEGDLIIVPADRSDIIVGTFLANLSHNYPSLAGILLTGNKQIAKTVDALISETDIPMLPMIALETDTQTAAFKVEGVSAQITLQSERKIALALGLFNDHVAANILKKRISLSTPKTMTPVRFSYMLYEKARAFKTRILLPESEDERILRAADNVLRRKLCEITLLGNPKNIKRRCSLLGLDLSKANIVDPNSWNRMDEFVDTFYHLRKHKGIIKQIAREMK